MNLTTLQTPVMGIILLSVMIGGGFLTTLLIMCRVSLDSVQFAERGQCVFNQYQGTVEVNPAMLLDITIKSVATLAITILLSAVLIIAIWYRRVSGSSGFSKVHQKEQSVVTKAFGDTTSDQSSDFFIHNSLDKAKLLKV